MSDINTAIIDAAEHRMRMGGFAGFSFREIASDVGIKSSSVHYHFPTKETLAAAVVRRYTQWTSDLIDEEFAKTPDPTKVWTQAFRGTLASEERMCPCIVLGAGSLDLPSEVSTAVAQFFKMCTDKMVTQGMSATAASELLATISGAMLVANALGDIGVYDRATTQLMRAA
jgi:TetR/AcrR family transcriptional repressor of nem operon